MIEFINVSKSFDDKLILDGITFKLGKGDLLGLIGPNGAGKTTIMNMVLNRFNFNGSILIDGVPNHAYIEDNRESIGFISDNPFLYDFLTGMEFIRFTLDMHKIQYNKVINEVNILFNLFDLQEYKNQLIKNYSFGMKRKISLISIFIQKPRYLLLDEPVLGLDVKSIIAVKKLLRIHSLNGSTILFSTHILDLMENLCNNIAILDNKKITLYNDIIGMDKNGLENIYLEVLGNEIQNSLDEYISSF